MQYTILQYTYLYIYNTFSHVLIPLKWKRISLLIALNNVASYEKSSNIIMKSNVSCPDILSTWPAGNTKDLIPQRSVNITTRDFRSNR